MRAGQRWGEPVGRDTPIVDVAGDDADLAAAALQTDAAAVIRFHPGPGSDLARALGLGAAPPAGATAVPVDLVDLGHGVAAANAVILGIPPDRLRRWHRSHRVSVEIDGRRRIDEMATTVVIANGQFLRGTDLVPRGHPGDGRLEVQVYALEPGERRLMRRRLPGGDHVPHPRITEASGKRIAVQWYHGEQPLEVDGRALATAGELGAIVLPSAARILV